MRHESPRGRVCVCGRAWQPLLAPHVASRRAIQTELRSEPEGAPFFVEKVSGVRCQVSARRQGDFSSDT